MPIVFQSKNFQVEPFADASGTSFVILRKKKDIFGRRKVVAKIPFQNQRQVKQDVKNTLKELEGATAITEERIRKARKFSKDVFKLGKQVSRELSKKPRKRKKKKPKKRR